MDRLIAAAFPLLGLAGLMLLLRPIPRAQARVDLQPLQRVEEAGASPRRRQTPAS